MNWLGGAKKRLRLMGCSSQNDDISNFKTKQVKLSEKTQNGNLQRDYTNQNQQDPLFNRFYYKNQLLPKYQNEKRSLGDEEEKRNPVQKQQEKQVSVEEKDDKIQLESFKFKKDQKNKHVLLTEPKKSSKIKIRTTPSSELKARSKIKEIFKNSSFTGPISTVLRSEFKRNKVLALKLPESTI